MFNELNFAQDESLPSFLGPRGSKLVTLPLRRTRLQGGKGRGPREVVSHQPVTHDKKKRKK